LNLFKKSVKHIYRNYIIKCIIKYIIKKNEIKIEYG